MTPAPTTRRNAFTLTELLIVMGVIGALSALTLVSVRAVTRDARLASATNTVTASLDNARAMAMKQNTVVVLVFRPRFVGVREQVVDVVIARWTGDTPVDMATLMTFDRFVPMFDVPVRSLPKGIKVAGPSYGNTAYAQNADFVWTTQTHLPAIIDPNSDRL